MHRGTDSRGLSNIRRGLDNDTFPGGGRTRFSPALPPPLVDSVFFASAKMPEARSQKLGNRDRRRRGVCSSVTIRGLPYMTSALKGGRGPRPVPKKQNKVGNGGCVNVTVIRGVQKSQKITDVIYGSPLNLKSSARIMRKRMKFSHLSNFCFSPCAGKSSLWSKFSKRWREYRERRSFTLADIAESFPLSSGHPHRIRPLNPMIRPTTPSHFLGSKGITTNHENS